MRRSVLYALALSCVACATTDPPEISGHVFVQNRSDASVRVRAMIQNYDTTAAALDLAGGETGSLTSIPAYSGDGPCYVVSWLGVERVEDGAVVLEWAPCTGEHWVESGVSEYELDYTLVVTPAMVAAAVAPP
jgi:hypothetical protein